MRYVLAGNQNCGKTALFNSLTGSGEKVGNFPGVTVDIYSGKVRGTPNEVIDLPGIYSFPAYTSEEEVSESFLRSSQYDCIINVVDATNLERNLYLTLEIIALGRPMVLAVNMTDELERCKGKINREILSDLLGIEVVLVSAVKGRGIKELAVAAENTAKRAELPRRGDICAFPAEFEHEVCARRRYEIIAEICAAAVMKKPKRQSYSSAADGLLTGKMTGIPIFFAIMATVFYITFALVGEASGRWLSMQSGIWMDALEKWLSANNAEPFLIGLAVRGAAGGALAVVSFLPTVLTLFLLLSILEDSGYMARAAFVLDRPFRYIGLSGKSFVPLLMGFGCSVPAIMATRTLPDELSRRKTVMLLPFVSCSAKIAVYGFIAQNFFPGREVLVTAALYAVGLSVGLLAAMVMKKTSHNTEAFLLELPVYRMPRPKNVLRQTFRRTLDFILRAFSVILICSVIVWLLQSVDFSLRLTTPGRSILAYIGRLASRVFIPLGFGDWRAATALITGIAAKENVVGTLVVLTGGENIKAIFPNTAAVCSFLSFTLLYMPCVAAMSAAAREIGRIHAAQMILIQTVIAYGTSIVVYSIIRLI